MSREEVQKLLGGYATGTLTRDEQRALFEAALEDQQLFDALAKEQALREILDDPFARRQLLEALDPAREPFWVVAWRWLPRPAVLAAAGGLAGALIVAGLLWRRPTKPVRPEAVVAELRQPQPPAVATVSPKEFAAPRHPRKRPTHLPAPPALRSATAAVPAPPPAPATAAPRVQPPPPPPAAAPPAPAESVMLGGLASKTEMKRASAAAPAPGNLGVRYGLLVKRPDGDFVPARLDAILQPGDAVRLRIEPNNNGYAYLFQRDPSGGWRLASSRRVERGRQCLLPEQGALQYEEPGHKELLLVLSRQPAPELASFTEAVEALASSARGNLLRSAATAYAVDTRLPATQHKVAFEIDLEYR
jgi:hypothetical protein